MISFALFLFLVGLSVSTARIDPSLVSPKLRDVMQSIHKACGEKHNIENDVVVKAGNGEFANDENFKCYTKCLLIETGIMDKQTGATDITPMVELLPESHKGPVRIMLETCEKKSPDTDLCERAYKIFKCSFETDPEHFFIF